MFFFQVLSFPVAIDFGSRRDSLAFHIATSIYIFALHLIFFFIVLFIFWCGASSGVGGGGPIEDNGLGGWGSDVESARDSFVCCHTLMRDRGRR